MEFNFNDNLTVESIDKVPADFQGLYTEGEDGKFKLDSDHAGVKSAIAAIGRMNTALRASRAEAKAAKGTKIDLSSLAEFGDTPETILEGINTAQEELKAQLGTKTSADMQRQLEKIKKELAEAHSTDLQGKDSRIQALTGQLHNILVVAEAKSALADAGAVDSALVMPFVQSQVRVEEKDGAFSVNVLDDAKDIRYSGVTGAPMTINELVSEMKSAEKYGPLFKSEAPAGGGTPPAGQPGRAGVPGGKRELSPNEKIAAGLNKGQATQAHRAS